MSGVQNDPERRPARVVSELRDAGGDVRETARNGPTNGRITQEQQKSRNVNGLCEKITDRAMARIVATDRCRPGLFLFVAEDHCDGRTLVMRRCVLPASMPTHLSGMFMSPRGCCMQMPAFGVMGEKEVPTLSPGGDQADRQNEEAGNQSVRNSVHRDAQCVSLVPGNRPVAVQSSCTADTPKVKMVPGENSRKSRHQHEDEDRENFRAQTPAATLYSAILREIKTKGKEARFKKSDRGQFVING